MEASPFDELIKFGTSRDPIIAFHYANIIISLKKDMVYNIDTGKRVPRRLFNKMIEDSTIRQYSTNPEHPVMGDLTEYQDRIGNLIVNFGRGVDTLVSNMIFLIEEHEGDEGLIEFAQKLYFIPPEFLLGLCSHPHFTPIMTKRRLWEELIRFSSRLNGVTMKLPAYFHIDRYYIGTLFEADDIYIEEIDASLNDIAMEGLVLKIASEQEFGTETTVILRRDKEEYSFRVSLGIETGYNIKST